MNSPSFTFTRNGFFADSIKIELSNKMLECHLSEFGEYYGGTLKSISIESNPDWQKLLAFLNTSTWEKSYHNNNIMDGMQWELKYKSDQVKIKSCGSNEFPPQYKKLVRLLKKVTGQYEFKI